MAVGVDVSTQPRRQKVVTFAPGPFKKYADGHPPEKATEQERRLYRKGFTLVRPGGHIVMARCPGPDWSVSLFETCQGAKRVNRNPRPPPGCLNAQTRPPPIWEPCETRLQARREPGLGLGTLENVPLGREAPCLLCRDSVTSMEVFVAPKAALGAICAKGPAGKEPEGLDYDGVDVEALWSRTSNSWDPGVGTQATVTVGLEVEGVGSAHAGQSGCWAGVLEALRLTPWTTAPPTTKDSPVASQIEASMDGCWLSFPWCCRSLRHLFGFFSSCRGFITVDTVDD